MLRAALHSCLQVFRQRPKYSMQVLHDALRILLEAGELATDRLFAMFARVGSQTLHAASWRPQWHPLHQMSAWVVSSSCNVAL